MSCLTKSLPWLHRLTLKSATTVVMGPQRPGRGVREVLEELGLSSNQANSLQTQLLAYNDTHDKELSRSLGDNYDNLPLKVSRNFLNSQGEQFFGTDRAKWLWPQDSAALVERIAEIMRRQHAYKHDSTRKRRRSRSSDSRSSRSRKSSRRSSLQSKFTRTPSRFMLTASQMMVARTP